MLVVTAPWCHHCRAMQPELDRLVERYGTSMRIEQIDAGVEPDRVSDLGVLGTPTVILLEDGVERSRLTGRVSTHDLDEFFASAGEHRPFPRDGVARAGASAALLASGWITASTALTAIGLVIGVWAGVTMWRWAR